MNKKKLNGFTIVEMIVSIAILSMVGLALSNFQRDVFTLNFSAQANLSAQLDARHLIKTVVSQLREASQSVNGAYPIALASTSALTFYSDTNNDGLADQIRYFMSGTSLKQGITLPTGSPLSYNMANEKLVTVVTNITNSASTTNPIFQYYDANYAGTSSPLAQPALIPSIRLIKMTVIIDKDPNKSPNQIVVTTTVVVRNLKDNY